MEPPHIYVHETSSSVVHHVDYLNRRDDRALCGAALGNPTTLDPTVRPVTICADCEAKLVQYHVKWWRERAEAATAELEELRAKYGEPAEHVNVGGGEAAAMRQPAQVSREIDREPTAEHGETTPTPLLDQARKEVLELCGRFGETVPYWRVKNCMDAFSDKLTSEERVLLAKEIGADGSLIRWCTKEIEGLGWQVTNNPVHADADTLMDAWTEDYYQTPKKTKWRRGRSRS